MRALGAAVLVAAVALSGCGGDDETEESLTGDTTPAEASDEGAVDEGALDEGAVGELSPEEQAEMDEGGSFGASGGSVTDEEGRFVQYPDGLRAEIVRAQAEPTDIPADSLDADHDTEVYVTVKLSNEGEAAIPLTDSEIWVKDDLLYGENGFEGQGWNITGEGEPTLMDLPAQLVPGTSVEVTSMHTMPNSELGVLRYVVNPDEQRYTDYVFEDVETLLE